MTEKLFGEVWAYGDNVNTDVILPARYLSLTEPADLARHCMEDIDPAFAREAKRGDIIVAGENFGCGSSREHAPLAFLGAGVAAVVAASFAMIFYRNAINVGLPILECPDIDARKGDVLSLDIAGGVIVNESTGRTFHSQPFPPFLMDVINAGGLVGYTKKRLEGVPGLK